MKNLPTGIAQSTAHSPHPSPPPRERVPEGQERGRRKQAILIFSILIFCYGYVHQGPGWNQDSRLDLLHAIFVYKTFKIDAYHENTGDKSIYNGHYYSDKAPGIVFLAIPAFALSAAVLHALGVPMDSDKGWFISDWIATAGSVALIAAIGGAAMFLFLTRLVGQRIAFVTVLFVFLGAAPFPYSTMLFSHAAVIGLLSIALWAIGDARLFSHEGEQSGAWIKRHLLAGVCCGLAISSEYTAALIAGGVLVLAARTEWRRGVALALGVVPALLLIPFYNWACFGSPAAFGYHNLVLPEFQAMNKGLFGITWPPKISAAYLILISPERGLFFWTPFFLIFVGGLRPVIDKFPKVFWICSVSALLHVVCISGYYMPDGGAALGPRHLAPIIPFVTCFTAVGLARWPTVGSIYGCLSIALTGIGTLITAMPPSGLPSLIFTVYLSQLCSMTFTNTIPSSLGFTPALCLVAHVSSAALICLIAIASLRRIDV